VARKEIELRENIVEDASINYNPMVGQHRKQPANSKINSKSGYLFKKGSGKMRQTWARRWFSVKDDLLLYVSKGKEEEATVALNLRVSMVKPSESQDRRFCFEVISPVK
jgi:Arf-GAP/coiled-coil/ANK repeat/PH domain-containing protein